MIAIADSQSKLWDSPSKSAILFCSSVNTSSTGFHCLSEHFCVSGTTAFTKPRNSKGKSSWGKIVDDCDFPVMFRSQGDSEL